MSELIPTPNDCPLPRRRADFATFNEAIDYAMATANAYSGTLQSASGDLNHEMGETELRSIAQRLLGETRHMQYTNRALEEKLLASRDDIAALQRDLDDVRRESMLDPLTKIANRKSFDEGLLKNFAEATEKGIKELMNAVLR